MGALKIQCDCNESQMNRIIQMVTSYLYDCDNLRDLSDIDEEIEGYRVYVDFEVMFDTVKIKSSVIQNAEWEELPEDTAVLSSRLKEVIKDFNSDYAASKRQAADIRKDQLQELFS